MSTVPSGITPHPPSAVSPAIAKAMDDLLDLPSSKLILSLDAERKKSAANTPKWRRLIQWLPRALGFSALAAGGLGPILAAYFWVFEQVSEHYQARHALQTAQSFLELRAVDEADAELSKAEALSPSSSDAKKLRARVDLEKLLRTGRTDSRSIGMIERRYKDQLATDEICSYLFGMASADTNEAKAEQYFNAALALDPTNPENRVRIASGIITLRSRQYEKGPDETKLADAEARFIDAKKALDACSDDIQPRLGVALLHAYAMIQVHRHDQAAAIDTTESECRYAKSADSYTQAQATAAKADRLEAAGQLQAALSYAKSAVALLSAAKNERGVYRARYTLARIECRLNELEHARQDAEFAAEQATERSDGRIRDGAEIELARIELLAGNLSKVDDYCGIVRVSPDLVDGSSDFWEIQLVQLLRDWLAAGWENHLASGNACIEFGNKANQTTGGRDMGKMCDEAAQRFRQDAPPTHVGPGPTDFLDHYFARFAARTAPTTSH
jgi:tetratricopeptide (TPR) repeat protein